MLTIRMQRTGRKGHAQFRVVVQDARVTPTSGKVVASLGHYNPHTKEVVVDKEKVSFYLEHGAQPSDRVARLLKSEGVKLPKWVQLADEKSRTTRNPDKLRKNQPAEAAAPAEPAAEAEPEVADEAAAEESTPAEAAEAPAESTETEAPAADA